LAALLPRRGNKTNRVYNLLAVICSRPTIFWIGLGLLVISQALLGCASSISWVHDPPDSPSCLPDRPTTWADFTRRSSDGERAAETVVRFLYLQGPPARLQVQFNSDRSWVKPDVADSWNRYRWTPAHSLLRHEQLHFAIHCLLTRQANVTLSKGGDPEALLLLLKAVARRINVQYDAETNHGTDPWSQRKWQQAVESQLRAGPLSPIPLLSSDK